RKCRGEPLRHRTGPSVSDLLARRLGQLFDLPAEVRMAQRLVTWDGAAAKEHLPALMNRCQGANRARDFVELAEARAALGDRKAIDEYCEWLESKEPADFPGSESRSDCERLFALMQKFPEHPKVAATAERLFGSGDSPFVKWSDLANAPNMHAIDLLNTSLYRVAGFRKGILILLAEKGPAGTYS